MGLCFVSSEAFKRRVASIRQLLPAMGDGGCHSRRRCYRRPFGELALLDPEPRSASVEAVEETRLFRLDRSTLFELMEDNVGVVSGIMHVLCSRLRRMTAIATGGN